MAQKYLNLLIGFYFIALVSADPINPNQQAKSRELQPLRKLYGMTTNELRVLIEATIHLNNFSCAHADQQCGYYPSNKPIPTDDFCRVIVKEYLCEGKNTDADIELLKENILAYNKDLLVKQGIITA